MDVEETNVKAYTLDGTMDLRGRPVLASKTGKWKACAFLLVYEVFERMAFYGIASNLVVYVTTQLHEDTVSSVRNVNNWNGVVWMTPILGAYLADSYLGRYWTFTISSLIYVLGMLFLTTVVSLKSLKPRCTNNTCNNEGSSSKIAMFYVALYVIALGAGGTKPNISTFGADQFDELDPHEKKLKVSLFNWWFFCAFLGGLFATLALVYIQENLGWGLGYGIPTIGLLLSLIVFYLGTPIYRHKARNLKSPTTDVFRVIFTAMANWRLKVLENPNDKQLENRNTARFRFLEKASVEEGSTRPPCTKAQVEKSKQVCGMIMIWLVLLIPSTIWAQINTLFVKQGTTLNRHIGPNFQVPAASLGSFVTLSMLLTLPIYDLYFVPMMRSRTGNPRGITLLQRIGIGCIIQVLAIAVAYTVEMHRMHVIKVEHVLGSKSLVPMSIFLLMPQYALIGVADVFNSIGLLEFFYDQSPDDMQSLGTTFFTSAIGVGNFFNSFLVTMVVKITGRNGGKSWIGNNLNDCHLDYYYLFLFVLALLNMGAFWWASSVYVYKTEKKMVQENQSYVATEGNKIIL
ncbi:protein NRT1/ PTR FAMILY 5.1 [Silene latifolia]|uniref:protein NRT1/ PTR FAMILY 5.1 n=1 Tax=Silene latifolia TaxID=37657 RepID=UPI003D77123A